MLAFVFSCLLILLSVPFSAGLIAGSLDAGRFNIGTAIALLLALLVIGFAVSLLMHNLPRLALPKSPQMCKSRAALYGAVALSVALGIGLALLSDKTGISTWDILVSSSPLTTAAAVLLIFGLTVAVILSGRWHTLLDEHERGAYDLGAVLGIYVYFSLSAVWWLAWRGQFAPEPDGFIILAAVTVTWLLGWLWRRYRQHPI